jgi:hypothetical protein
MMGVRNAILLIGPYHCSDKYNDKNGGKDQFSGGKHFLDFIRLKFILLQALNEKNNFCFIDLFSN